MNLDMNDAETIVKSRLHAIKGDVVDMKDILDYMSIADLTYNLDMLENKMDEIKKFIKEIKVTMRETE